jgi:hypothetical protein
MPITAFEAQGGTSTTGEKTSVTTETPFDKGKLELHSIRIMGVIANVTVFGFQPLDRFNVLEDCEAFFQFRVSHECNPPSLDNSPIREQKPRLSSRR